MKISTIKLFYAEIPLTEPYLLSFTTVSKIISLVVKLEMDNGVCGYGEVVPLYGYSVETEQSIISDILSISPHVEGMDISEFDDYVVKELFGSPFSMSALLVAKEMISKSILFPDYIKIPLVASVSSCSDCDLLNKNVVNFYNAGYRTLKLKVGVDIDLDIGVCKYLLDSVPDDFVLRIDANQGYSVAEAHKLLDVVLEHHRSELVEIIEQPYIVDGWNDFKLLSQHFPSLPLMLDESIVEDLDLDKAVEVGSKFIKLKLCKHKGFKGVQEMAQKAKEKNIQVVFGNGVSTDMSNLFEAMLFVQNPLFFGAIESNGFLKLQDNVLLNPPTFVDGYISWEKNPRVPSGFIDEKKFNILNP